MITPFLCRSGAVALLVAVLVLALPHAALAQPEGNSARVLARSTLPPETVFHAMIQAADSLEPRRRVLSDSSLDVHLTVRHEGFRATVEGKVRPDGTGGSVAAATMYYSTAKDYRDYTSSWLYKTKLVLSADDDAFRLLPLAIFQRADGDCATMDSLAAFLRTFTEEYPYESMPEPEVGYRAFADGIQYPDWARAAAVQGRVVVEFLVSERGTVDCAHVLSGPNLLAGTALREVVEARWRPAVRDGKPAAVNMAIPLTYRLRRPR